MLRKAVLNPTIANPTIVSMIQNVSNSSSSAAAEEVPAPVNTQASMSYDADIMSIIMNNEYVKSCVSNKKKDKNSLSYLIRRPLSQSDCIKLGVGVEKVIVDMITSFTNLANIKTKNEKGIKEKDHLFCDEETKTIYYAELKANINLDTEKSKSTYEKCLQIVEDIKQDYPGYQVKWCLLACRFLDYDEISPVIQKKYSKISDNLFGFNQYMKMLGINIIFTQERYTEFLNNIADNMFKD